MLTSAELQLVRNADPGAKLPGLDVAAGNPLFASTLSNYTTITQSQTAPYHYWPAMNEVIVSTPGVVLSGINFGSATLVVNASNVTVKDCTFTDPANWYSIAENSPATGLTVEDCSFLGPTVSTKLAAFISGTDMDIENNSFINTPADTIHIAGGTVSGNYISGGGYQTGSHADAIWVFGSPAPTNITDNFIDWTQNPGVAVQAAGAVRITNELGPIHDVSVTGNFLLGGGYTVYTPLASTTDPSPNVAVTNNYIGFSAYGPFYKPTQSAANLSGNTIVDFSNPMYSNLALSAYLASGLSTASVLSATSASTSLTANLSTSTTLLGNGNAVKLYGSANSETVFDGGFGSQYMYGGQGANIFTYLAMSDSTPGYMDNITNFDPAKDVIDLSRIDANLSMPGTQSFTFIGTASFTGVGGQVSYQQDPAKNATYVEVALAGDKSADLEIQLNGLLTLTAANFALTPTQSTRDLAAGAAMPVSKILTPTYPLQEFAYTNVQGQTYTSFQAFYVNATQRAADVLNLGASQDELLLYDPNLTITRGNALESLQDSGGSGAISYHSSEIIQIDRAAAESFVFETGFGHVTIYGASASGANADSIQLPTSSFSYLTSGMTQAQDLAVVLSHATSNAFGVTIADTRGDTLMLAGLNAQTIAASPTLFHFA
jgi:hypothetical protein